jgi:SAM-dependent methyltransferase
VLDVACGSGRHLRWLSAQGFQVAGVDRDADAIAQLAEFGEVIVADLESTPWPLPGRRFDAVVVTNYLWRPLFPALIDSLADGGVLIYETFADGQQTIGRPSRPEFLLRHGELLKLAHGLHVIAYEDGFVESPARFVQRIAAAKPAPEGGPHPRWPLGAAAGGDGGAGPPEAAT